MSSSLSPSPCDKSPFDDHKKASSQGPNGEPRTNWIKMEIVWNSIIYKKNVSFSLVGKLGFKIDLNYTLMTNAAVNAKLFYSALYLNMWPI